jgi:predicted N-acetyltransferase YhbS
LPSAVNIGRAAPEELPAIDALMRSHEWEEKDLEEGEAFVARDNGEVIGVVRVIEVAPRMFVIDDVLMHRDRRGRGVGADLMRAAMGDRSGDFYLVCHDERVPFYSRLGFTPIEDADYPGPALEYAYRIEDLPNRPDHMHRLMHRVA